MSKRIFFGTVIIVVLGVMWYSTSTSRAGNETAVYTVEKKDGKFEIRKYETITVASTQSTNQNSGFGKLFKFISGENESSQKIAMTTPVFMPASDDGKTTEMMFVVPVDVVKSGVPKPGAGDVSIKTISGGRFAAIRASGRLNEAERKAMLKTLRAEIKSRNLQATGNPIYAGYDPPWTPGPMRRNEVMLRLK